MTGEQQPQVPWGSFIPYHVARDLAADPGLDLPGLERRVSAVVLVAEVSGFSALSTALARGQAGAEELTAIANAYFTPIIALIQSYGGIVATFSADAFSAFFPTEREERDQVARRAVACAIALQPYVSRYARLETSAGMFSLGLRMGMASGRLLSMVVGSTGMRLEPVIVGDVVARAASAQAAARPGEVVVDAELLPDLGWARAEPRAGPPERPSFVAVTRTVDIPAPAPLAPLAPLPLAAIRRLSAFLAPTLAQRLESGERGAGGEHHASTALCLAFSGFDYDNDPQAGLQLQRFLARVFAAVQRHEGYISSVVAGEHGGSVLALFGTPVAREDDADRALRCALELRDVRVEVADGAEFSLRLGLASGLIFSGLVGSSVRQSYTVIGDAVHGAAWLALAAGPGEILVEETTTRAAGGGFAWGETRWVDVQSRSGDLCAFPLLEADSTATPLGGATALVGRGAELALLHERLSLALEGRGQVVGVKGAAGVGKTALVGATMAEAGRYGVRSFSGEAVSYRGGGSYLVWRPILRALLGLDRETSAEAQAAQASAHLRRLDARLLPRLPLLNALTGLQLPENELTAGMEREARKLAIETLTGDLIAATAAESPLMIVIESCQWIDALSRDLLFAVSRRCAGLPILLVFTYRGPPESSEDWAAPLSPAELPHSTEVSLEPLGPDDMRALILGLHAERAGQGAPLAEPLVEQILARAQGNPLFAAELLGYIHERGIDVAAPPEGLELPDSLHGLVLRRIERLGKSARTVLKVASVMGQEFDPRWLAGIYPTLVPGEQLDRTLEELRRAELAVRGDVGAEPAYLFRHMITREVAYESLSAFMRADLHTRVGEYIEATYARDLEPFLDLLAYHYGQSGNREKQREYLLRAGMAAQAAFANETAVSCYEQLLPLLAERERSDVLLRLGQVLRHVGRWDQAETVFREALRFANDQITAARCRLEQGSLLRERGDPAATDWLEAARRSFAVAGDADGLSDAEQQLGLVALAQNQHEQALQAFERAIKLVAERNDKNRTAKLLVNLGAVYWSSGDLPRALDCFERSLRLAGEAGNRHYVGVAVGNLGGIYHLRGDYGRAFDCYAQTLQCAFDVGDRLEMCISIGNLGHIYEDQGEYGRAKSCYLRSLEIALDLGDRMGIGMAMLGLAALAAADGELAEAIGLAEQAEAVFLAMDAAYELADSHLLRADLEMRVKNLQRAQELLGEASALADDAGNHDARHRAAMFGFEVAHQLGAMSTPAAVGALRSLLDDHGSDEQRADLLATIVRVDGAQAAARAAAAGLYRSLHLVTPKIAYRRAYSSLMGVALPTPAPLPAPPQIVMRRMPNPRSLLERATSLIDSLHGELLAHESGN
jgi:class 3 adenylate cyclase/tetratricopeptide (TPR) repeat protein